MQVFFPKSFENFLSMCGMSGRPYSVLQPSLRLDGRTAKRINDCWNLVGACGKPKSKVFGGAAAAAAGIENRFGEALRPWTYGCFGGARKACGRALSRRPFLDVPPHPDLFLD